MHAGCCLAAQAVGVQQWSKQELTRRVELCEDEDVLQEKQEMLGTCDLCNSELQEECIHEPVEEAYCVLRLEQQWISALEMEPLADPSFCHWCPADQRTGAETQS